MISFVDFLLAVPEEMNQKLQDEFNSTAEEEVNPMHNTSFPDPPTFKPLFERLRKEEEEISERERLKEKKKIAEAMLSERFPTATVTRMTGLSEQELEEIKGQM
ncbi:hypothetical protein HUG15_03510 [Salicibibacter cibarius]|uniref:Transposase n=1 Tax=Salicibibacter cibarius TaxID=2743000 RepID=A0A7T7CAE0_9BACI|nr:hypothetical protein [Salicibibacter cibarius]QQK74765.1 hypothetical protein HUG15_03510 [Salicibibacter cibarius]